MALPVQDSNSLIFKSSFMKTSTHELGQIALKKIGILILLLLSLDSPLTAQNNTNLINLSGGIAINLGTYQSFGIQNRRDPFSYLITGNLNFRVKGFNIPVGASFSQQESRFLQPFNQVGFSPKYKWVQSHFGYRSLSFNPFTLNGHTFLGTGLEVELPTKAGPKIYISAMYGRMRRAVDPADAAVNEGRSAYKRIGYGAKVKLVQRSNSRNSFAVDVFKGSDRENSISTPIDVYEVLPKENVTVGLSGQYQLFRKLTLTGNYGFSALTRDSRSTAEGVSDIEEPLLQKSIGNLFLNPNSSTQYRDAYSARIAYDEKFYSIGLDYKRIDPGYETLGSYYFQNDIENIALSASTTFNNRKVRISGSIGQQSNNIDEDKSTKTNRLIGSLAYNQSFSSKFAINASLSNYSSELKVERDELSDSLNLYQINTSVNFGMSYIISPNSSDRILTFNSSYQVGNSRDEYRVFESENTFYMVSAGYRHNFPVQNIAVGLSLNMSKNIGMELTNTILGPFANVTKSMNNKKTKIGYTVGYNSNSMDGVAAFGILSNRVFANHKLSRKSSLNFNLGLISKIDNRQNIDSYSELRARTTYKLNF